MAGGACVLQILSPHPEETEVPLNLCPAEVGSPQERVTGQGIPPRAWACPAIQSVCCSPTQAAVGGGGLRGWKGNLGLGQAGQEAESL